MSEEYPIIIDSRTAGTLTVTPAGLTTEFLARCADPGRLIRLSVYGEGGEGYLGVMEPMGGALTLCRRLSRAAMALFPERIDYAAESGAEHTPGPAPAPFATIVPQSRMWIFFTPEEFPLPMPAPPPSIFGLSIW